MGGAGAGGGDGVRLGGMSRDAVRAAMEGLVTASGVYCAGRERYAAV